MNHHPHPDNRPTAPTPPTHATWTVNTGLLLIALATLIPIMRVAAPWFKYIYAAGALSVIAGRLMMLHTYAGCSLRVRRLARMELWAAVIFGAGTFFVFWPGAGPTDWLAFTLAGAVLQVYASTMLPRELSKQFDSGR